MARRKKIFHLPFRVETWFERDRASVVVYDFKDNIVFEAWDENVGQLIEDGFLESGDIKGSALDYAAYLLGFKDYYDMRSKAQETWYGAKVKINPPDLLERELRKFDKSPSKYISSLGIDPAQFPGLSSLKGELTYTENEAMNVYSEGDAAALIVKKVTRKLGV